MNTEIPDYEPISLCGSGSFGCVIEAYDRIHDTRVAIKRSYKIQKILSREYEILSKLTDCEYIVKLIDIFYSVDDNEKLVQNLVFEYVSRNLKAYIEEHKNNKKFIDIEKIRSIIKQILFGLDYCHKRNIVHRDLKPANVLITEEERVKICDFGVSKIIKEGTKSSPIIGTQHYRAPELILGSQEYNSKIDIFAAGCILAELFMLDPLFPGRLWGLQILEHMIVLGNPGEDYFKKFGTCKVFDYLNAVKLQKIKKMEKILNPENFYKKEVIDDASDLILKMLDWDYDKRYSVEECLKHKFFHERTD